MGNHMKICKSCNQSIQHGSDECQRCSSVSRCSNCGAKLKQAMLRCRECDTLASTTKSESRVKQALQQTVTLHNTVVAKQAVDLEVPVASASSSSEVSTQKQRGHRTLVDGNVLSLLCGSIGVLLIVFSLVGRFSATQEGAATLVDSSAGIQHQAFTVADPTAERAAANWVVRNFGVVTVKTEDNVVKRFVAIEHLPSDPFVVTEINLASQEFDESELSILTSLTSLRKLDLSKVNLTSQGLAHVGRIPNLRGLYLRGNRLSPDSYGLLENSDQIEILSVSGSKTFDDFALAVVSVTMQNLRTFSCASTNVTEEGSDAVVSFKSLKKLTATRNNWSREAVARLRSHLPGCQIEG